MSNSIQVVDNFLPDDLFYPFARSCMVSSIYGPADFTTVRSEADGSIDRFGEDLTPVEEKSFADTLFQSVIFSRDASQCKVNDFYLYYPLFFRKLEEMLNVKRWWVMRINCTIGQLEPYTGGFHRDFDEYTLDTYKDSTTSILYLNSNNGGTKFRDTDTFVESKRNRLVTFPTDTFHAAVSSTNAKLRFVLNMNYETK